MKTTDLLPGVQDFLGRCPKAGEGVNRWIFLAALTLHRARVPESEMPSLIASATKNCGRVVTDQEIQRAVVNSGDSLKNGIQAERRTPKWPALNVNLRAKVVGLGVRVERLKQRSPVTWTDDKPHTEEIVDLLFPNNPLLCVAQSKYRFNTLSRERWRGRLYGHQFIVPSPMTRVFGTTKGGKQSQHALDNTGPRRFLIVEFDKGTFDEHAAILMYLAQSMPFVMAVHSGSKSLHGWFFVHGMAEQKVEKFFRKAVSLGADPQLWIRSQFVRLPDGRRENGARQAVLYFDPQATREK